MSVSSFEVALDRIWMVEYLLESDKYELAWYESEHLLDEGVLPLRLQGIARRLIDVLERAYVTWTSNKPGMEDIMDQSRELLMHLNNRCK